MINENDGDDENNQQQPLPVYQHVCPATTRFGVENVQQRQVVRTGQTGCCLGLRLGR